MIWEILVGVLTAAGVVGAIWIGSELLASFYVALAKREVRKAGLEPPED